MTTLYWQVYKSLEREFIQLSEIIYIDDKQLTVYSMKIADLLIRTAVEIEALAKELYKLNFGKSISDSQMYFDTICIKNLNDIWALDKKKVMIVSPDIYLSKESEKSFCPLNKASKSGNKSADWNKAYQAVKHDRVNSLTRGNIKNLLHGLGALYILNLYYKDSKICNVNNSKVDTIDASFGSALFAVEIHIPNGLNSSGSYEKKSNYDECVYICDYEPNSKKRSIDALKAMEDYVYNARISALKKKFDSKLTEGAEITKECCPSVIEEVDKDIFPVKDPGILQQSQYLGTFLYNIVLNKNQY